MLQKNVKFTIWTASTKCQTIQLSFIGAKGLRSLGWKAVGEAQPYAGIDIRNDGSSTVAGLRAAECTYWREHGFGPGFWWSD